MTKPRVPAGVPTGGQFAASARSESDVALAPSEETFVDADTCAADASFLAQCGEATPESILDVGTLLAASRRVVTWWHPLEQAGSTVGRQVREPRAHRLDRYGNLVLVDADGEESDDSMDWSDDPDKAARHRIHPDGNGLTLYSPFGEPMRTHRIAEPDEALTSRPQRTPHTSDA